MSPARSTARLAMKRFVVSGLCIADWAAELPCTVWLFHSDSTPPRFVYWFCIISRGATVSRLLPPCDGTVDGGLAQLVGATVIKGPVNVEVEMLFQSTWNL